MWSKRGIHGNLCCTICTSQTINRHITTFTMWSKLWNLSSSRSSMTSRLNVLSASGNKTESCCSGLRSLLFPILDQLNYVVVIAVIQLACQVTPPPSPTKGAAGVNMRVRWGGASNASWLEYATAISLLNRRDGRHDTSMCQLAFDIGFDVRARLGDGPVVNWIIRFGTLSSRVWRFFAFNLIWLPDVMSLILVFSLWLIHGQNILF